MPTDENNGVVSQNQQTDLNGSGNQFVQNSGTSDDFDFNFDDNGGNTSTIDNVSTGGDSHIFTNPDSSESQDIQSQPVINHGRTGMFKTPDEQEAQQQDTTPFVPSNEDSFLSDIDPDDVSNNDSAETLGGGDLFDQNSENVSQDASKEALDQNIEEMISFDDDPKLVQETPVGAQSDTGVDENNMNTSNVQEASNIQEVVAEVPNTPDVAVQETVNTVQGNASQSGETNGDDWLQQEDKEVEDAFGSQDTADSNSLLNVNMSGDDVAQNVENIITNQDENVQQNDATYVPDENEYSQMSNLLNSSSTGQIDLSNVNNQPVENQAVSVGESVGSPIVQNQTVQAEENAGSPVVENVSTPVIENVGTPVVDNTGTQVVENTGIPSVENPGPIDMNNLGNIGLASTTVDTSNIGGSDQTVGFGLGALNATMAETPIVVENSTTVENSAPIENSIVVENPAVVENSAVVGNPTMVENPAMAENPVQNESFNLDSIEQDIQNLSVGSQILQQEGQNIAVNQGQVQSQVQSGQVVQQNPSVTKRKKQSGFKAIGIFVGVIVLLGGLGFAATKMFPDKFNLKSIFGGDKIVEYIDNSGIVGDLGIVDGENENDNIDGDEIVGEEDENLEMNADEDSLEVDGENIDEENPDVDENAVGNESSDVNQSEEESSQHDPKNGGDVLDPNSLAALLSDDTPEDNQDGDGSNTEENLGETVDETVDETSNQAEDGDSSFDPFAEMNELLDENADYKARLEDYLSKGELYKDLGTVNGNKSMEKIGDFIMTKAQEQLTKLENGEEIDTTVFDLLDKRLEQAQNLANN